MKVYKFGGASIKDATGVKNVAQIIASAKNQPLVVVASAMGKMTNTFEILLQAFRDGSEDISSHLKTVKNYHQKILDELSFSTSDAQSKVDALFDKLEHYLSGEVSDLYDFDYDQIVSYGELLSTTILSAYLTETNINNKWVDARTIIRTNNTYREANVEWEKTEFLINQKWESVQLETPKAVMLTQGFIGHTGKRATTTLGREGSDFSASILAYSLGAESVTIWKDVPGVLNADPKFFNDAIQLPRISYKEAIELAYYGASVIHPKTIKPLQNKQIKLYVRSFKDLKNTGTCIDSSTYSDALIPSFIFKVEQILISFMPRDFSFIAEDNLSELFGLFAKHRLKIRMMQNSAINFSICVDFDQEKLEDITKACKEKYEVLYNQGCELVTIRHYNEDTIRRLLIDKKVLVEQRSRSTVRMVLQPV
jgi:aspartate kinase